MDNFFNLNMQTGFENSTDRKNALLKAKADKSISEEKIVELCQMYFSKDKISIEDCLEIIGEDSITLDMIKAKKIAELRSACSSAILAGFESTAFDGVTPKMYDCEMTDQARISGLVSIAQLRLMNVSAEPLRWKASGEMECYEWLPEQILMLGLALKNHIEVNTDKFYTLRIQTNEAETIEAINNIVW